METSYADEFPLLGVLGLYAASIRGDGNCLFNALSDQVFGDQDQHTVIRARVISYMRLHADYYKQFLDVKPGGGTRRNPKRKNAGAFSEPRNSLPPTAEEIDKAFESHLDHMARGGTWGDNMEIVAFAAAYNTDVRIYLREYSYMIPGQGEEVGRTMAHIAYHDWEHYSSIRNRDGPHTGLPGVIWKPLSPEDEQDQQRKLSERPQILPWQIDVVRKSLPFLTDNIVIKKALEACRGNVNNAVSMLIDENEEGSISSTQGSSSVEREQDSDDEMVCGPNKRANHSRIKRATRNLMKEHNDVRRDMAARLALNDGSQESVSRSMGDLNLPDSQENSPKPEADDDWQRSDFEDVPSATELPRKIRLKINPPRSPDGSKVGKTHVRQQGPRQRAPSARERKELKKFAQKAARKQRQQQEAKVELSGDAKKKLPILPKPKAATPIPVEGGMRTLYI